MKHLAVDITSHLRQIRQIRPSSDAVRRLEVDTDVSRALKVVKSCWAVTAVTVVTRLTMHSGQDHRAILASQMKLDSDDW